jgi:asparagine synthase (glutamine-hydrolysing)
MCGICGVIQLNGEPRQVIARAALDRMTDAMTHRGPNDRGTHVADGIAIGVRRLSIVDVAGGHQPVSNEDGTIWAAQNGELYNHEAERFELERDGHQLRSRCDTEILPHLYERYGADMAAHLRGKFAFVIWDEQRRRAVVARDRLGVKPLYYAHVGDIVVFASELKSILASGLVQDLELDYEAIDAYLALGFFPGPHTPLLRVAKLMPGHSLIVEDGAFRTESYWTYPAPAPVDVPEAELVERLRVEFDDAVKARLMSDVPLGAMLSGGLDSSLIVASMAEGMTGRVKTFTVGFEESGKLSELEDARYVSRLFDTEHEEVELSLHDRVVDLADLVWSLDEPVADLSALGFLALSDLASQHVTVALSGQGADELFGGYTKHRAARLITEWERLPSSLRRPVDALARQARGRFRRPGEALGTRDPVERLLAMSGQLRRPLRSQLVSGRLAELDGRAASRAIQAALGDVSANALETQLYLDAKLGLVDDMLLYFDRTSMARSLEVRVPFLDHHVVEFAATVPSRYKVNRLTTKYLLKQAARGIVPDRIIDKPKIGFFRKTAGSWLQAQTFGSVAEYLRAPDARVGEFLDRSVINELILRHASGDDGEHAQLLLSVLVLEVWLSTFVPRALAPPEPQFVSVAS